MLSKSTALEAIFLALVICGFLSVPKTFADVQMLSETDRTILLRAQDFNTVRKVEQIPRASLLALNKMDGSPNINMVGPGQSFPKKDMVNNISYQWKQLQFAAISKDYVFIHFAEEEPKLRYYYGLFHRHGEGFEFCWMGYGPQCRSLAEFVQCLQHKQIKDDLFLPF